MRLIATFIIVIFASACARLHPAPAAPTPPLPPNPVKAANKVIESAPKVDPGKLLKGLKALPLP